MKQYAIKYFLAIFTMLFLFSMANAKPHQIITLPKPILNHHRSLDDAILHRRSIRQISSKPLTSQQVSKLLWAAQGMTAPQKGFRAAPSAGALYPLELYLLNKDGVWHYLVKRHALALLTHQDIRSKLPIAAYNQRFLAKAPVIIIITGIYTRETKKYGKRGIRFTQIEAGHVAENIALEAVNLNLVSTPVGGFKDQSIRNLLKLPRQITPLYLIPMGAEA